MRERSFILDYIAHGDGYTCSASLKLMSETARLQRWLDVEVALAKAQGDLNIIPADVVDDIERNAKIEFFDLDEMRQEIAHTKHSLMPLLHQLEKRCSERSARYVHWGATTQDIQDTAQSMELRDAMGLAENAIVDLIDTLLPIADDNRKTIMTGRTHSKPASPITFGFKVATWIDELLRCLQRLKSTKANVSVSQLFGSVGTGAAFGSKAEDLLRLFSKYLNLRAPDTPWHMSRDRVADFAFSMAMASATVARIADELRTLNRSEIGEVELSWQPGEVGSSCMPHKRNPEDAEQIVVLARLCRAQVPLLLEAMIVEHERDYRATRLEWPALGSLIHYGLTSFSIAIKMASRMRVVSSKMESNAIQFSHSLCVENLLLALSVKVGRQTAYTHAYRLAQSPLGQGAGLKNLVKEDNELKVLLTAKELDAIFDINNFVGPNVNFVISKVIEQGQREVNSYRSGSRLKLAIGA